MTKTLNCMIVDDEPIAREILVNYIAQVPYLNLAASCEDAFEAMAALNSADIDLIFLDINMPRLTGFEMLRSLKKYPAVIITSAYPEHALESFEWSVTDYLLKPFSFPRFVQATEKVVKRNQESFGGPAPVGGSTTPASLTNLNNPTSLINPINPAASATPLADDFLVVRSDKKLTKIFIDEILFVEAYGNYISIQRERDRILSKQTLTQFEQQLPPGKFIRIHKSYIVSLKAIKYLEGNQVSIGDKKLPIGKVFKENLVRRFS